MPGKLYKTLTNISFIYDGDDPQTIIAQEGDIILFLEFEIEPDKYFDYMITVLYDNKRVHRYMTNKIKINTWFEEVKT
jgi:hypothetical protein